MRREIMTKIIYVDVDLNKIANGSVLATDIPELGKVHQEAIIEEKEMDLATEKDTYNFCPLGYRYVDLDETKYQVIDDQVYVPIQVEYGNLNNFKQDAHEIHEHKSSTYFQKWLLCAFLADSLPFDVAARVTAWFSEE